MFLDQVEALIGDVARQRAKDPVGYRNKNAAKRLAAIFKLIFQDIPQDPSRPEYRQGTTLGADYKHWFRAKFLGQYRLFFRYDAASRTIVYAWVNDEVTLRAYGSRTDAYSTFGKMLNGGNPPDDWDGLLKAAATDEAQERLKKTGSADSK